MKRFFRLSLISSGAALLVGVVLLVGGVFYFSSTLPQIFGSADYRPLTVTQFVMKETDGKDRVVAEFFKERRYVIPFEKIPKVVIDAFISAEDDQFFQHQGISWMGILRAGVANMLAGHVVQGGSTITQQVVKSLFLTPERNLVRKAKEAILAGRIEKNLSKQQILYLYLNQIYLGSGAHGIQAAAKLYFHKDVSELTLPEAALLAGMPRAPGRCTPLANPVCAKDRQSYVLKRMKETGRISAQEMSKAVSQPLRVYYTTDTQEKSAAYLIEHVRRQLVQKFGEKTFYEDGLRVELPSQLRNYQIAETSVRQGLRQVDKRRGYRGPVKKIADPKAREEFLSETREDLYKKKVPFLLLTAEGKTDPTNAALQAGIKSEEQLLDLDELYPALLTRVDDQKKTLTGKVGNLEVTIPYTGLSWIQMGKEARPGPLSRSFSEGDVILIRPVKIPPKGSIVADLEQHPQLQGALLSMEARTGYITAMIGGYNHETSEFNRAVQAQRQSGSSFKPIIYAAGLENGFTPASIIVDSPLVYSDDDNGKWKPSNYENKFYGDISFRQALIKSMNIPTIKIVQALKVPTVISYARRLGINSEFSPDLSISLGSANLSLLDLTQVYALFPRLGRKIKPIFIQRVLNRDGTVLEENPPNDVPDWVKTGSAVSPAVAVTPAPSVAPNPLQQPSGVAENSPLVSTPTYPLQDDPDQVLDPRVAYVMTHLMKEVVEFGTGAKAKAIGRPIAGKTGTTNEYRDAWFMGYTPYLVTGAWVGFDDQQTLGSGETGSAAAIPIWLSYMKETASSYPADEFAAPRGIVFAWIDQKTGRLAPAGAVAAVREAFLEGTAPTLTTGPAATDTQSDSDFLKEELE